jgi:hypothetical protein
MKSGHGHSAEARRRIVEGTRRKISEGTRRGIGTLPELRRLHDAWRAARPSVRHSFIVEVLAPVIDHLWSSEWGASP